jgi:hypothetical protein
MMLLSRLPNAAAASLKERGSSRARNGFALAAALLAIVLIGALVTGVMFATTEDTRIGATAVAREIAMMAAESALATAVSDPLIMPDSIGLAASRSFPGNGSTVVIVYITRLDSSTCWIVADALPDFFHSGAKRRVGVLAHVSRTADGTRTIAPISERWWSELF